MKNIILLCLILFSCSGCGVVARSSFYSGIEECKTQDCLISYIGYPSSSEIADNGNTIYTWSDRKTTHKAAHYTSGYTVPDTSRVLYSNGGSTTIYSTKTVGKKYVGPSSKTQQCTMWAEFSPSGEKVRFLKRGDDVDCHRLFSTSR